MTTRFRAASAVYLDSSAGVKLVLGEPQSPALRGWLAGKTEVLSSALFGTELLRAVRREAPEAIARARAVISGTMLLTIDDEVLELAARLDPLMLRTLDAIHLASAIRLGTDLDALVTYDRRMIGAAQQLGLPAISPA